MSIVIPCDLLRKKKSNEAKDGQGDEMGSFTMRSSYRIVVLSASRLKCGAIFNGKKKRDEEAKKKQKNWLTEKKEKVIYSQSGVCKNQWGL
jgi:hypothetical protein